MLLQADADRKASNWAKARDGYLSAQRLLPDNAAAAHNLALCHLALEQHDEAIAQARRALRLNPALWQSALILAKALIKRNEKPVALGLLQTLHAKLPQSAEIRVELANLTLHLLGDAPEARRLVQPLLGMPNHGRDAEITTLVTQLYDRDEGISAMQVNQAFLDFGAQQLQLGEPAVREVQALLAGATGAAPVSEKSRARPRVGLISPQFFASPVYFFAIGALQPLSRSVDLVVFNRGGKSDWATEAFRRIATDWHNVQGLSADALAREIAHHGLDVLVDLGGWMDPEALHALSAKPARRLYKWVGGQSVTTGLRSFDGFLTDRHQTPEGFDSLYSEPLIRLESGYVTYTPPPYMPEPPPARQDDHASGVALGVIANPGKVSRAFLADLAQHHRQWQQRSSVPITLRFIDYRYQQPQVMQRVQSALPGAAVQFICPGNHREYLSAVGQLDATIDTWPYSGGLTTIEALALGVPTYTRIGELFCERHTVAHCLYAGMTLDEFRIDQFDGLPKLGRRGFSLLQPASHRVDHERLAGELLALFS